MKYKTKIISAFPGTGKSIYHSKYPDITLDSDSSNFSWIEQRIPIDGDGNEGYAYHIEKIRNPEFPQNYINHIKENIGKYKYIFVSSHKEVRDVLFDNCLFFYLIWPPSHRKEEFIQRYKDRGNSENFIELISSKWEEWEKEIWWLEDGCKLINLVLDNLEDEIRHLEICWYGGDVKDEDEDEDEE